MNSGWVSWLSPFICMVLSARIANVFLKASPRLYTAMALFACCWAILLPYYGSATTQPSDMFRAISGFLLVYIGGLLMLEAQHRTLDNPPNGASRRTTDEHETIVWWHGRGLWLLLLLAAPPFVDRLHLYSEEQAELVVGIILDLAGFLSVTTGLWMLCGKEVAAVIGVMLGAYAAGELVLIYNMWPNVDTSPGSLSIPASMRYAFALGKILIALTFGSIIAYKGMDEKMRARRPIGWIREMLPG